ncbi:hypothetical protein SHELI_v1c01750 [Spiroplasma helicoides]|uniref:Uncharacterized protein n=1 Tax=Spiroplasma helicoides TaxID=216938 RepID=A0A1B3SJN2_9MOLU|nr:hypothetical protein [Spiroplasma helicoides]AOG60130.1 hypothetical protein SHELI_v1c01750 [Spiroplasma helicoides]
MDKLKIWKFFMALAVTGLCILNCIFAFYVFYDGSGYYFKFNSDNILVINIIIFTASILYLFTTILHLSLKNSASKAFGVINLIISVVIIAALPITLLPNNILGEASWYKVVFVIPAIALICSDSILTVLKLTGKLNPVIQQNITQVVSNAASQPDIMGDNIGMNVPLSNIELKDATELKMKIQMMQSGLSKSYDEAIEEIEKTGQLNGMELKGILDDLEDETPTIIPYSYEQVNKSNASNNVNKQSRANGNEINFEDPLAELQGGSNSMDYESINSTSLSGEKDNLNTSAYKYLSRRVKDDRGDAH